MVEILIHPTRNQRWIWKKIKKKSNFIVKKFFFFLIYNNKKFSDADYCPFGQRT